MEKADQAASIANGLFVPDHLFVWATAGVLGAVFVFLDAELLVRLTHGKDEKQGISRPRNKGEELWIVDAEDIVELELLGEAQVVDERGHDLGVVLWTPRQRAETEMGL